VTIEAGEPPIHAWAVRLAAVIALCGLACHNGPAQAPLAPAGKVGGENEPSDDGAGDIALASARSSALLRVAMGGDDREKFDDDDTGAARSQAIMPAMDAGGDQYGGDPYGGTGYAGWVIPRFDYVTPMRIPRYTPMNGLTGAIEGTISWTGAAPTTLATPCGAIENPTLRVGPNKELRGALVYIDHVSVGRALPPVPRIGGAQAIVVKRGCAFLPAAQVVTAWAARAAIHGDTTRTRVRLTATGSPTELELQEGGMIETAVKGAITRIEADDGSASPAWLVAVDSPYFTLTDDSGHYRLEELAAGTYDLVIWQAPVASVKDGHITFGSPVVVKRTFRVEGARTVKLDVTLK
jgi:hypothetical protein